jgi:hypothetical protein
VIKNYHVSIKHNYILVIADGAYDQEEAKKMFIDVAEIAKQKKLYKILFDARKVIGNISTMDRHELGVLLAQLTLDKNEVKTLRVTIVGTEPTVDPKRFAETVAVNRGAILKVCTDYNEAVEWLGI